MEIIYKLLLQEIPAIIVILGSIMLLIYSVKDYISNASKFLLASSLLRDISFFLDGMIIGKSEITGNEILFLLLTLIYNMLALALKKREVLNISLYIAQFRSFNKISIFSGISFLYCSGFISLLVHEYLYFHGL